MGGFATVLHGAGSAGSSAAPWNAYRRQADDGGLHSAATRLKGAGDDEKLKEAAREFEALFIGELWKSMRNTMPENEFFGRGNAEKIYQSMLDQEYAHLGSERGDFGLAEELVRQLTRGMDTSTSPGKKPGAAPAVNNPAAKGEHAAPAREPVSAGAGSPAAPSRAGADEFEGREFVVPVEGRVSSAYGLRSDPFSGAERFHHGLDLAAPGGTPVRAAADGRVVFSGQKSGYGNVVEIEHEAGDYRTLYAHNQENLVSVGERVRCGEVIARVGSTGRSTGPHLHFEVAGGEGRVDPAEFI